MDQSQICSRFITIYLSFMARKCGIKRAWVSLDQGRKGKEVKSPREQQRWNEFESGGAKKRVGFGLGSPRQYWKFQRSTSIHDIRHGWYCESHAWHPVPVTWRQCEGLSSFANPPENVKRCLIKYSLLWKCTSPKSGNGFAFWRWQWIWGTYIPEEKQETQVSQRRKQHGAETWAPKIVWWVKRLSYKWTSGTKIGTKRVSSRLWQRH